MSRLTYAASLALSAALVTSAVQPATAATFSVLYNFKNPGGGYPLGRLYGVGTRLFGTGSGESGESGDYGQVFELTHSGGSWTETAPLVFDDTDGAAPAAGLIAGTSGDYFGTTSQGDANGAGNVFLLHKSGSSWTHNTLWAFGKGSDGQRPLCDLIKDSSGNLYGTTSWGGSAGDGMVFELTRSGGTWTEAVLHNFTGGGDGATPVAGLLADSTGALYGTTQLGGDAGSGTVFRLSKFGVWSETILHSFGSGSDGAEPLGVLIKDSKGDLYGTTTAGGSTDCLGSGCGTVFEVFKSGGVWTEKTLYAFTGGSDGAGPQAGLRRSASGALYGTTVGLSNQANVFELTGSGGVWSETTLHTFNGGSDGGLPLGQVILDKSGALYGTAYDGGAFGYGTVWKLVP